MDAERERWRRVSAILDGALDLPAPARGRYLDEACGADAGLRREVEELLAAPMTGRFLAMPAAERAAPLLAEMAEAGDRAVGRVVGSYRLLSPLGEGGMGTVYLAERADGQFEQLAAVKLLRHGLHSEAARRRFLQERQILARLAHPAITRLLDGGVTEEGTPFFVMERIDGAPVTTACDERRLGVEARLAVFLQACDAVQYAHRNLVVHRDLKPSNILLDASGAVKLLDFGIAKLLAEEEGEATRTQLRALTPEYAAPEQLSGAPVTTATDVYALGVLLYELLTGERPYRLDRGGALDWARAILEQEPVRPSARGGTLPGIAAHELRRRLRGDLDLILLRALQKEPERRYPSAEALASDVRRHLEGLPLAARGDALGYRTRKFLRRHRLGAAAAALVLGSLVAGLLGTTWQARRAVEEARKAAAVKDFLKSLFSASDPAQAQGQERTARQLLEDGARRIQGELRDQPEVQSEVARLIAGVYLQLGEYGRAQPLLEADLELRRRLDGPRSVAVAESMNQLGNVLYEQERFEEAGVLYRQALEIHRRRRGERSPQVAETLWNLAGVRRRQGALADAERLQRRALETYALTRGVDSAEAMAVRESLAITYADGGRYAEAEREQAAVAAWQGQSGGPDHPETLNARFNHATYVLDTGRFADALAISRDVVARMRRVLGGGHHRLALALRLHARTLHAAGRSEPALAAIGEALAIDRALFGAGHPQVAMSLAWQALIETRTPRLAQAERDAREALRLFEAAAVPRLTLASMQHYAGLVLAAAGRLEEADAQLSRAAAALRGQRVSGHLLGLVLDAQGDVARRRGETAHAERLAGEALRLLEAALGPGPATALARVHAGAALCAAGRAGEPLLRAGLRQLEGQHVDGHFDVALARELLGEALAGSGRRAEARPLLQAAFEWRRERLGAADPRTLAVRRALARLDRTGVSGFPAASRNSR